MIVGTLDLVAMELHICLHKHISKRKITFIEVHQKIKLIR